MAAACLFWGLLNGCTRGGQPGAADSDGATAAPEPAGQEAPPDGQGPSDAGGVADGASPDAGPAAACPPGSRAGAAGKTNDVKTAGGLLFNVRTPIDYGPTVARPLVVVYAASGGDRNATEGYTGLTAAALARGFVIAYADHVDPNAGMALAAGIPGKVSADWCIDQRAIYLSGHSDGASVANTIPILLGAPRVAAIAPYAAGTRPPSDAPCPMQLPLSVMVIHSKDDKVFPGYGTRMRDYWLKCNECDKSPLPPIGVNRKGRKVAKWAGIGE